MISFFPIPYKEELLYSILSRYHIRSSNISFSSTLEDLFNSKSTICSIDLPSNIDRLIDNMPIGNEYTSELVIKDHTLFNFYTAFLDKDKKLEVINILKGNNGKGIHSKVEAAQQTSDIDNYFRICPICYKEEIDLYGEGYLHRVHNTPGVLVCNKHRVPLSISKEPISFFSRWGFINLRNIDFIDNKYIEEINTKDIETLSEIAEDIEFVINNEVNNKPAEWFVKQYKNRLKQLNLCTPKGIVNINEVSNKFVEYYGDNVLKLFNLNEYSSNNTNWIKYMIRNQNYVVNPLKHILLIRFLGINIKDIFNKKIEYKPFGDGPWKCFNKICPNYLKPSIEEFNISYNSKLKRAVGEFQCNCGYTYLRSSSDSSDKEDYEVGKVMKLGHLWETKLIKLIKDNLSLNQIERKLGTSQNTIKKYAAKLGLNDYLDKHCKPSNVKNDKSNKQQIKELKKQRKIKEYRKQWLDLIEENPLATITQLREMNITAQDYLYRHDREWLYKNYPQKIKRFGGNQLVNWEQRDLDILEKVKVAVQEIEKETDRPKKITITLISKKLKIKSSLLNNIDRLTKTKEFINEVIDTNKSYQIKKVKWAMAELIKQGEAVRWWKVYDKAGLNEREIVGFKYELKNLVESIKSKN